MDQHHVRRFQVRPSPLPVGPRCALADRPTHTLTLHSTCRQIDVVEVASKIMEFYPLAAHATDRDTYIQVRPLRSSTLLAGRRVFHRARLTSGWYGCTVRPNERRRHLRLLRIARGTGHGRGWGGGASLRIRRRAVRGEFPPHPLHSPDESCSGPMRVHLHDASERRLLYSPAHLSPLHPDGFDDASSRPLPGPSCAAC
jgi:hypothetical protein